MPTAPNALGETDVLRERWLREAFERAVSDTSASINEIDNADETSSNALLNLDQDAAMALLKEINADLAASRIRQKMAVKDLMITIPLFYLTCPAHKNIIIIIPLYVERYTIIHPAQGYCIDYINPFFFLSRIENLLN